MSLLVGTGLVRAGAYPAAIAGLMSLTGCLAAPGAPAGSCMQNTLESLQLAGLPDSRQHCLAAGTIAIRCGEFEAAMAGYGKELADVFGPGDAERRDLAANRAGRRCAAHYRIEKFLDACCAGAGY